MFFPFRKKFHIVVVCTANRTRSAYFAGYFQHYLSLYHPAALRRLKITSAGTNAVTGGRVNDVVALIARNHGFSLRRHLAEPLTAKLIKKADLIVTMEQEHKDKILEKYPGAETKVFRLMEYGWQGVERDEGERVKEEILDVPDPTGKNVEDFQAFIDTAHAETDRLMHELMRRQVI